MSSLNISLTIVVVVALSGLSSALFPQYAQFFPIDTCNGPHIYALDTVADFQKFSNASVFGITQRGMWIYTFIKASNPGVIQTSIALDGSSSSCLILSTGAKIMSAERVFNSDLEFSEIALFADYYEGTRVVTNQTEFRFPQPMAVRSYAFTGTRSWAVFPNIDFTGTSTCLRPQEDGPFNRGYQISGRFIPQMMVGSLRLGCDGETKPDPSQIVRNSQPTSINDDVISTSVFDSKENEVRVITQ